MRYAVVISRENGMYGGHVPDVMGAIGIGDTPDEVLEMIRGDLGRHLRALRAEGKRPPRARTQVVYLEVP
jgi:predicted RNase H-like HicB family nuclease